MRTRTAAYIGVLAVAGIVVAGFFFSQKHATSVSNSSAGDVFSTAGDSSTSTSVSIISESEQPPPNTNAYQSDAYHFSLFYPDDLSVSEQPEPGDSMVVLFKDPSSGQSFDIFITPYDEPKITQARFLMDEPSGVMQDPVNILIDGAPATEFLSTNPAMGASREIWFLHGGFLYEVTAPQSLDSWLQQIMETWQFM